MIYYVYLQGFNSFGILIFKFCKYKTNKFNPIKVIEECEKRFSLKDVSINHYVRVEENKK